MTQSVLPTSLVSVRQSIREQSSNATTRYAIYNKLSNVCRAKSAPAKPKKKHPKMVEKDVKTLSFKTVFNNFMCSKHTKSAYKSAVTAFMLRRQLSL